MLTLTRISCAAKNSHQASSMRVALVCTWCSTPCERRHQAASAVAAGGERLAAVPHHGEAVVVAGPAIDAGRYRGRHRDRHPAVGARNGR